MLAQFSSRVVAGLLAAVRLFRYDDFSVDVFWNNASKTLFHTFSLTPLEVRSCWLISRFNSIIASFTLPSDNAAINIFDVLGREIYSKDISSGIAQIEVPITHLQNGIYYLKLTSGGKILTQKFEVMR